MRATASFVFFSETALGDFEVLVGHAPVNDVSDLNSFSLCTHYQNYITASSVVTIECDVTHHGRYVAIRKPNVEAKIHFCDIKVNAAFGKQDTFFPL